MTRITINVLDEYGVVIAPMTGEQETVMSVWRLVDGAAAIEVVDYGGPTYESESDGKTILIRDMSDHRLANTVIKRFREVVLPRMFRNHGSIYARYADGDQVELATAIISGELGRTDVLMLLHDETYENLVKEHTRRHLSRS